MVKIWTVALIAVIATRMMVLILCHLGAFCSDDAGSNAVQTCDMVPAVRFMFQDPQGPGEGQGEGQGEGDFNEGNDKGTRGNGICSQ